MDHRLDLLAAYCNQLALRLVQKEHQDNERALKTQGSLLHQRISIDPLLQPKDRGNYTQGHQDKQELTPAQKALMMVELASREDKRQEGRSKSPAVKTDQNQIFEEEEAEAASEKLEFPWEEVNNISPFSRLSKLKLKCLLTSFYRSHPKEVKKTLNTFNIKFTEFQQTLKDLQNRDRRNHLKRSVLERSAEHPVSLNEFKMLARRIYTNRWFRPTDRWCLGFIRKYKLGDCVLFSK